MTAQLERAGTPAPKAICIDEISTRKGHSYRIVVSDLIRGRRDELADMCHNSDLKASHLGDLMEGIAARCVTQVTLTADALFSLAYGLRLYVRQAR